MIPVAVIATGVDLVSGAGGAWHLPEPAAAIHVRSA